MNAMLKPRVKETSTTTGTGTLSLAGAVSGFQTFVAAFGTGNACYYSIVHGTAWEVGIGTVTDAATDTLSRDTILASSAGGAALNLGAGTKTVFCDVTAEAISPPQGHIFGLTLSNNSIDATNDIDIATGVCASDDASPSNTILLNPAAMTKQLDAVWAAGTGAGGRLSSNALADGTWHVFAFKPSSGTDDFFFSTSVNPTPPSGTKKRRIGSISRLSASIAAFTQDGDYFVRTASRLDVSVTNPGTSATLRNLSVIGGVKVKALLNINLSITGTVTNLYVSDPDVTDVAPSVTAEPLGTIIQSIVNSTLGAQIVVQTSTGATIRTRLSASDAGTVLRIATLGWWDTRGRNA